VASVDDVESHLNTQELVEKSVEPKPITMTRAEVYAMHGTLMREEAAIVSQTYVAVHFSLILLHRSSLRVT
jgi:hypothetical protein